MFVAEPKPRPEPNGVLAVSSAGHARVYVLVDQPSWHLLADLSSWLMYEYISNFVNPDIMYLMFIITVVVCFHMDG